MHQCLELWRIQFVCGEWSHAHKTLSPFSEAVEILTLDKLEILVTAKVTWKLCWACAGGDVREEEIKLPRDFRSVHLDRDRET